jgi:hypothetical protein
VKSSITTMARTIDSDWFNMAQYKDDYENDWPRGAADPKYKTPRPSLASQIDLAQWYLDTLRGSEWPKLDENYIGMCMQEEYIEKILEVAEKRTPIDALQNFALTLVHEVSMPSGLSFNGGN